MTQPLSAHILIAWPLRLSLRIAPTRAGAHFQRQPCALHEFHRVAGYSPNLHSNQMQVTPRVLIVAAMVTLLFMVPAFELAASAAIFAGVSAEAQIIFLAIAAVWAVAMARFVGE